MSAHLGSNSEKAPSSFLPLTCDHPNFLSLFVFKLSRYPYFEEELIEEAEIISEFLDKSDPADLAVVATRRGLRRVKQMVSEFINHLESTGFLDTKQVTKLKAMLDSGKSSAVNKKR